MSQIYEIAAFPMATSCGELLFQRLSFHWNINYYLKAPGGQWLFNKCLYLESIEGAYETGSSPDKWWNHNTEKMAMTPLMYADKKTVKKAGDGSDWLPRRLKKSAK